MHRQAQISGSNNNNNAHLYLIPAYPVQVIYGERLIIATCSKPAILLEIKQFVFFMQMSKRNGVLKEGMHVSAS